MPPLLASVADQAAARERCECRHRGRAWCLSGTALGGPCRKGTCPVAHGAIWSGSDRTRICPRSQWKKCCCLPMPRLQVGSCWRVRFPVRRFGELVAAGEVFSTTVTSKHWRASMRSGNRVGRTAPDATAISPHFQRHRGHLKIDNTIHAAYMSSDMCPYLPVPRVFTVLSAGLGP